MMSRTWMSATPSTPSSIASASPSMMPRCAASRRYSTHLAAILRLAAERARQLAQPLAARAGVGSFPFFLFASGRDSRSRSGASTAISRRSMRIRSRSPRLVVVADEMQRAVDDHVRPVRLERLAVAHRLAAHDLGADHEIAERQADIARHAARHATWLWRRKRQHVRGLVLAAPHACSTRGSRAASRRAPRSRGLRRDARAPPRPSGSCARAAAPRRACRGRDRASGRALHSCLFGRRMRFVRLHDALHERMTHHVRGFEERERDARRCCAGC